MISKTHITYIRSLHDKAIRHEEWLFLVEWRKSIGEFIDSGFEIIEWFFTEKYTLTKKFSFPVNIVTDTELSRITTLNTNDSGVLLVKMKSNTLPKIQKNELVLVLDCINDPGNLWTIIRTADWYGISHIIASRDTVDCYNGKVLMATMGSFSRVSIYYTDIDQYLSKITWKIYWAFLNGENIHTKKIYQDWIHIVIGSEAHGISSDIEKYITDKITIPRFGLAESLNAGVATAIIVDRIVWSMNK